MTFAKRGPEVRQSAGPFSCPVRRWLCCAAGVVVGCSLYAASARADVGAATSDRAAREEALRAIPWRQLHPQNHRSAQFVISGASIYRRLPTRIIDCDPEMFTFLVQHPEVVIDVWRLMGLSQVTLQKLPSGAYRGADGAGTAGTVRFLHADWGPNAQILAVVLAEGTYDGPPLVAPVKAQSLFVLRSGAVQEMSGRHYITVRVDSFVRIENVGVELVAKTLQPWIAKTADQNFIETLTFVSHFSRTAEKNPHGIERLAARLPNLDDHTRNALVALSFRTAERYARNDQAMPRGASVLAQRAELNR